MSVFLKKNWKWILGGTGVVVLAIIAILAFRVISFIGDTTGGGRTQSDFATATPDVPATSTAQARAYELFGTPTQGNPGGSATTAAATPSPTPNFNSSSVVQRIKNGEPVSILLTGYGGGTHDGSWLTDSVLVMRYDSKTKTIMEFNVPRDLYLYIPYGGKNAGKWGKVNTILGTIMTWNDPSQDKLDPKYRWSDAKKQYDSGMNLLADSIEPVLGFKIDYWAGMSFDGFRKFIDAMGGVDIDVERAFVDNQYPKNDDDRIDASYITISFKAGLQHMDGETAIRYARSRHSETPNEGGDFARSKRQMRLISAVKEKVLKENLVLKSLDYMSALQGNLRFSLDFGELTALANYFNSAEGKALANDVKFSSEVLGNTLVTDSQMNGDYVLLPIEGQGKYAAINRWVQSVVANADIRREGTRVQVLNSNGTPGVAGKFSDFLLSNGFRISESQDGPPQDQTELLDYTMGASPNTVARLKSYLPNLKVTQVSPDKKPANAPAEANMQLLLGKDFKGANGTAQSNQPANVNGAVISSGQTAGNTSAARREDAFAGVVE